MPPIACATLTPHTAHLSSGWARRARTRVAVHSSRTRPRPSTSRPTSSPTRTAPARPVHVDFMRTPIGARELVEIQCGYEVVRSPPGLRTERRSAPHEEDQPARVKDGTSARAGWLREDRWPW